MSIAEPERLEARRAIIGDGFEIRRAIRYNRPPSRQ